MIQTYQDCVDNAIDFLGGGPGDQVQRNVRQAIAEAYREIPNAHNWPYLYRQGRIYTVAPYGGLEIAYTPFGGTTVYSYGNALYEGSTCTSPYGPDLGIGFAPPSVGTFTDANGDVTVITQATIQYQQSSGQYPYMVTLTGGTWPPWASAGFIRIAGCDGSYNYVAYRVAQVISATVLTFDAEVNPGQDLPAGTTFLLYQDTYLMPPDFIASDKALYELNIGGMEFVHPREWLYQSRYVLSEGTPVLYTITGDIQYPGKLVMRMVPFPVQQRSIDFIYKRRPRPMVIQQYSVGSISLTSGSTTVTTSTSAFTSAMVGSILRVSPNTKPPSSAIGSIAGFNPCVLEATILSVVSGTVAIVDTPAPGTYGPVGYYVSDPVDFEQGAMLNCFLRCVEKCIANLRNMTNRQTVAQSYQIALDAGRDAASTSFARRVCGPTTGFQRRLRDMGFVGPDQS